MAYILVCEECGEEFQPAIPNGSIETSKWYVEETLVNHVLADGMDPNREVCTFRLQEVQW